jgi:serine/threonine protein kinase
MVLEHVKGISLKTYLAQLPTHRFPEAEAAPIFLQLLQAVAYCHSKGITHRDLKLENILLTPLKQVKIIDFGFSTWTKKDAKLKTFCGTPTYMAPEIINKGEYQGPPTDMWALGVILYVLLCGSFPFHGKSVSVRW